MLFFLFIVMGVTEAIPPGYPESQENEVNLYDFPIFTRLQWHAREPVAVTPLLTPVPYVVIHHSATPAACYDTEACSQAMRTMQNMHMDDNKWWDIGYNFAVGSDGAAYEGRGWELLGAQAKYFNSVSIGICIIGDWTASVPPANQLKTVKALIAAGVQQGFIRPDYRLVGHRQVRRGTECPGNALAKEIKSWHHYSNFPANYMDLIVVEGITQDVKDSIKKTIKN